MSLFSSEIVYVAQKGEFLGASFDQVAELGARAILKGDDGSFAVYIASHNQRGDIGWNCWTEDTYRTQFEAMIELGIAYKLTINGRSRWYFSENVRFISGDRA